jgi:transcriptional regulator GlxA family with amidase domain
LQAARRANGHHGQEILLNPRELATNQMDVQFLRRTIALVETHMSDFEFDVEALSQKMFMSRRQLFRKLKGVAGCAPNAFIRNLRLKRAAQLLREPRMTVTEITYAVGFSDLKHFRAIFREHFGVLPGEYGAPGGEPGGGPKTDSGA